MYREGHPSRVPGAAVWQENFVDKDVAFPWRGDDLESIDRTAVAGKSEGVDIHERLGEAETLPPAAARARDAYEGALELYFEDLSLGRFRCHAGEITYPSHDRSRPGFRFASTD